jgi:hypothetical protein
MRALSEVIAMRENILKIYALLLLVGSFYFVVLLGFQYGDIYSSWYAFFSPQIDALAYTALVGFYALAIGTPAILALTGVLLLKHGRVKWYLAAALFVLLILSDIVGKLILLAGIGVYIYLRVTRNHLTNVAT